LPVVVKGSVRSARPRSMEFQWWVVVSMKGWGCSCAGEEWVSMKVVGLQLVQVRSG